MILFQFRKDPSALIAERNNFLQHSRLKENQLISFDVYRDPTFEAKMIKDFNGFFVGGLSDDPANDLTINAEIFPFLTSFNGMLDFARLEKIPGFLSCGGFMLAIHHWGSKISMDPKKQEMGVYTLIMEERAVDDILLKDLPTGAKIISGHKKNAEDIPAGITLLASTHQCPVHIIKLDDAPIYAFQGHPEMTTSDLKSRVTPYKEKYFDTKTEYEEFLSLEANTTPINQIVSRFVDLISRGAI